jgi:hypothetical protein
MDGKWLQNLFGEKEDSTLTLTMLHRSHTPVLVEIERSLLRFKSLLTLKDKAVVIAKPAEFQDALTSGDHVRIRWSGAGRHEMRLEVVLPHINLPNGHAGFVCRVHDGVAQPRRNHERFDVSRFSNLKLTVGGGQFRVLDLCISGCRLARAGNTSPIRIAPGHELPQAALLVGSGAKVALAHLIPRSEGSGFICCEFEVMQDGKSPQILQKVIHSVEEKQIELLHPHEHPVEHPVKAS